MQILLPETKRLYFRQHVMDDLDAYCMMEADPDFRRYVGGRPRPRAQAEQRFMKGMEPITHSLQMWAAVYKPENKYIGRCGIYPHFDEAGTPIPGEASLGLYFDRAFWGQGLATEAGRAFINFGFERLKLNRIVAVIDSRNIASIVVIEKLGFRPERTSSINNRSFNHYQLLL